MATISFALPLVIVLLLYIIVCRRLWSREIPGKGANHNQTQAQVFQTARKVTRMMIMVVVLFLVCWRLPCVFRLALHACLGLYQTSSNPCLFLAWQTILYSGSILISISLLANSFGMNL